MPLFPPGEVSRSLTGAWRLTIGRADGLALFDASSDGFWRSFLGILILAPVFALLAAAERSVLATMDDQVLPAAGLHYAVHGLLLVTDFIAFPLAMVFLAQLLGVTRRYALHITAFNWSSVLISSALCVPLLLHAWAGLPQQVMTILIILLFMVALRQRWFTAVSALEVNGWVAAGLVFIEFSLSLILGQGAVLLLR